MISRCVLFDAYAFLPKESHPHHVLVLPFLTIDHDAHKVMVQDTEVNVTPKEYELILYLVQNPDKVFSREDLLKDVWHYEYGDDFRTIDTHIKRLREKFKRVSPDAAHMISTVWGIGYKLEVPKMDSV